ncbi:ROK family transcriptional regulator [Streptomyces sp. NPDC048479]|uniref:ROK family transcriptional regulator n=1 Tax=Streptomyces sp. NPDC048479 TaxID=3154725 RepID=UPI00341C97EA
MRSHNAALVLDLLRTAGESGISRMELAERTGLTPQAVSKITARLREEGLAVDAGRRASTGGRPGTVLRLVPSAGHAVGLHLDRDELTLVLLDLAGAPVAVSTVPLDLGARAEAVVERVATEVEALSVRAGGSPPLTRPFPKLGAGPQPPGPAVQASPRRGETTGSGPQPPGPGVQASPRWGETTRSGPRAVGPAEHAPAAPAAVPRGAGSAVRPGATDTAGARPTAGREPAAPEPAAPEPAAPEAASCRPEGGPPLVLGVGVAMPGPLDHATGVPHRVTGFPQWDGFPLRDALAARLGLPVVLDKDTNAAALGLALRGSGDSFAYLHLGTGLGAGLVLGGSLYRGARTGAGEFGHQVIQLDGPECGCGKRGCIEALCLAAVDRGDLDLAARVLGTGAANLVELLDIDRVLLGGRVVAAAAEPFVRGVGECVRVPVGLAEGGAHVVAEGAAQLVLAPVFGRAEASPAAPKIG